MNSDYGYVQNKNTFNHYAKFNDYNNIILNNNLSDIYKDKNFSIKFPINNDFNYSNSSFIKQNSKINKKKIFIDNNEIKNIEEIKNMCPLCDTEVIFKCNCHFIDSICKNNHKWHIENGLFVLGHTH